MARIRSIKPSFFTNDELAPLDPIVRLLFIGLWTVADREGRLEDRPLRIKAELMPFDTIDIAEALTRLESVGMVTRYEVEGRKYIEINNFHKHQKPHPKESDSSIPSRENVRSSRNKVVPGREKDVASRVEKVISVKGTSGDFCNMENPAEPDVSTGTPEPVTPPPEKPAAPSPHPGQAWDSFLATEWVCYFRGTQKSGRDLTRLTPFFHDLLGRGHDPATILTAIRNPARARTQMSWDFERDYFPAKRAGPAKPDPFAWMKEFVSGGDETVTVTAEVQP